MLSHTRRRTSGSPTSRDGWLSRPPDSPTPRLPEGRAGPIIPPLFLRRDIHPYQLSTPYASCVSCAMSFIHSTVHRVTLSATWWKEFDPVSQHDYRIIRYRKIEDPNGLHATASSSSSPSSSSCLSVFFIIFSTQLHIFSQSHSCPD